MNDFYFSLEIIIGSTILRETKDLYKFFIETKNY